MQGKTLLLDTTLVQITNTTINKFNQIQATKATIGSACRKAGWVLKDCKISELRDELVKTVYRGADGKTVAAGTRQYKSRAKASGTLNKNTKMNLNVSL